MSHRANVRLFVGIAMSWLLVGLIAPTALIAFGLMAAALILILVITKVIENHLRQRKQP